VDLPHPHPGMSRILVVKLGALGNVILSLGPFAAIRRHHGADHVSLLTTRPWADWLAQSPYFDEVLVDDRPEWWDLAGWWRLRRRLIAGRFDRVYDLQTSARSSRYFHLFPRHARPEWSGIALCCSHPDRNPNRNRLHDIDRQFAQLRAAGVTETLPADLSWTGADLARFALPDRFALLVPGSSAHRRIKRWPGPRYAELAGALLTRGIAPVILGAGEEEGALARTMRDAMPHAIDLTNRTGLPELASLARAACFAIGNDTGPMHLIAAAGCRSVVLFSRDSDPALTAPRGRSVTVLRRPDLAELALATVLDALPPHAAPPIEPPTSAALSMPAAAPGPATLPRPAASPTPAAMATPAALPDG
jgi:ADP-heptose:LPS heptosyltransferase